MNLLKQRKSEDPTTAILPAEIIEALHLAEDDILAWEASGEQIVLRRAEPERQESLSPERRHWTAEELLKLSPEERDRILAVQAALAEEEYRTNRDLTDFSADKNAWLFRKGYTKLSDEIMDHMEELKLGLKELGIIAFIIRLQEKPPKRYIESYTALAKALRVNQSTLYRWLHDLENPVIAPGGEVLRPAYLKQDSLPRGIRYSVQPLYDHLQTILAGLPHEPSEEPSEELLPVR